MTLTGSLSGLAIVFAAAVVVVSAAEAGESTWTHNGSTMLMTDNGGSVTITYLDPRASIRNQGVRRGTLLFSGVMQKGEHLYGTAYVFRSGCQPAGYDVSGDFTPDIGQERFELVGASPQRERDGCEVVGYSGSSKSGALEFSFVGSDGHSAGDPEGQNDDADDRRTGNASEAGPDLPVGGRSYGGKVRGGPGMDFEDIGSLQEGDRVRILAHTGTDMGGYEWFKIRFQGRTGYHWGGIMCSDDPVNGMFQHCQ